MGSSPAEVEPHPLLLQVSEDILLRRKVADTTSPRKVQTIASEASVVGLQALGSLRLTNRHISHTPGGGRQVTRPHYPVASSPSRLGGGSNNNNNPVAFTVSGWGLVGFPGLLDPVHRPMIVAGQTDPTRDHAAFTHKEWFFLCGDVLLKSVPHTVKVTLL